MYKVIVKFTDLKDNNYAYAVGDVFPRTGVEASKERLTELSTSANRRGFPLIEKVEEAEAVEKVETAKKEKGRRKKDVGADSTGDKELLHP